MTPKIPCTGCGAEILQRTADRTGGLCMRCARDGPPRPPVDPSFPLVAAADRRRRSTAAEVLWRRAHPANVIAYRAVGFLPDGDHLLVNSGHGQPYAAIRSRKLAMASGEEIASVRLGDELRCFRPAADSSEIIGCTNKRLVVFDERGLRRQFRKAVPRYVNFLLPWDRESVLLATDSSLCRYDMATETCDRRRIPSCEGLFRTSDGGALVCAGATGELLLSDGLSKPRRIGRSQPFKKARASQEASVVWQSLKLRPRSPNVVLRCDLRAGRPQVVAFEFPVSFERIEASEAGDRLFLVTDRALHVVAVSGFSASIETTVTFEDCTAIAAVSTTDPYLVAWHSEGEQSYLVGMRYQT